jgi:hypothetical protein
MIVKFKILNLKKGKKEKTQQQQKVWSVQQKF